MPAYFFSLPNAKSAYAEYGVRALIESTPYSLGFLSSTCNETEKKFLTKIAVGTLNTYASLINTDGNVVAPTPDNVYRALE
jgi:hypothetical protein